LSDDERARLLKARRQWRNGSLHTIVVMALSTGTRSGEIMNLRWPELIYSAVGSPYTT
jgi:integrase